MVLSYTTRTETLKNAIWKKLIMIIIIIINVGKNLDPSGKNWESALVA